MCYLLCLTFIVGGFILWHVGSAIERLGDQMIENERSGR